MSGEQKFHRGDLVHIARDLGPEMAHFEADRDAIVMHSYRDKYGGENHRHCYSVMFADDGRECCWYDESQLTMLRHVGEPGIAEVQAKRARECAEKSDLGWIVANWPRIRENPPGATMAELMRMIGITEPWGTQGEGMAYYANMQYTRSAMDPILGTGDIDEVRRLVADFVLLHPTPAVGYVYDARFE